MNISVFLQAIHLYNVCVLAHTLPPAYTTKAKFAHKHAKYKEWRGTATKALLYQQFLDSKVTSQRMSPHGINKDKLKQHTLLTRSYRICL